MRPGADVQAAIDLIRTAKENPPDDWLYWLIWEYGLEVLLPYLADPRVVLDKGLQWQRIRGTPDSLSMAFEWLGLGDTTIEEEVTGGAHWFEYMLDPGRLLSREELRNVVGLAKLSAPLRSRLARIYHGLDLRRAIWDETAWSDGSLWSDYSGVYDPDTGVIISFGRTTQSVLRVGEIGTFTQVRRRMTSVARYIDKLMWDQDDYDVPVPVKNYDAGGASEITTVGQGVGRNAFVGDGRWIGDGSLNAGMTTVIEAEQYPVRVKSEVASTIEYEADLTNAAANKLYNTVNENPFLPE